MSVSVACSARVGFSASFGTTSSMSTNVFGMIPPNARAPLRRSNLHFIKLWRFMSCQHFGSITPVSPVFRVIGCFCSVRDRFLIRVFVLGKALFRAKSGLRRAKNCWQGRTLNFTEAIELPIEVQLPAIYSLAPHASPMPATNLHNFMKTLD
jgi:hypothetical protein